MSKQAAPNQLIQQITVKAGFSLSEVRKIRKDLRDLFENVGDTGYWLTDSTGRFPPCNPSSRKLVTCFVWCKTKQGYEYWSRIHTRLWRAGTEG